MLFVPVLRRSSNKGTRRILDQLRTLKAKKQVDDKSDREYFTPTMKVVSVYPKNLFPLLRASANKQRCSINLDLVDSKTGEKRTLTLWDKGDKPPVAQFSKRS